NSFENLVSLEIINKYQSFNHNNDIFKRLTKVKFPKLQYFLVDVGKPHFFLWSLIIGKTENLQKLVLQWNHRLAQDVSAQEGFLSLILSIVTFCPDLIILKMNWINDFSKSIKHLFQIFKDCAKLEYFGIFNSGLFDEDFYLR